MKWKIASLALLLLAGAAPGAYAQDAGGRHGHWGGGSAGGAPQAPAGPQTAPAPQAAPAPRAPDGPGGGRRDWFGRAGGQGQGQGQWQGRRDGEARQWQGRRPGDAQAQYQGHGQWQGQGQGQWQGRRQGQGQGQGQWQGRRPGGEDHRWDGRGDGQARGDQGRQGQDWRDRPDRGGAGWGREGDRRWDQNRERHRGDLSGDRQRWAPHRYPPAYSSVRRFHAPVWRAPRGYFVRDWRFGEILPGGWYGPEYRLLDWWSYDLPEPPPGYDWVRVGDDALLVDDYSGRIVQVVRDIFW